MEVSYDLRRYRTSKSVRLSVSCEYGLLITAPKWVSLFAVESIIRKKEQWVIETLTNCSIMPRQALEGDRRKRYLDHREQARSIVHERLAYWNQYYQLSWGVVSIRDQRSRWGSCSRNRNLSFSYKIAFLPMHLADYIIVHELCHILEMNHSSRFWGKVEQTLPNHRLLRKELKNWRLL